MKGNALVPGEAAGALLFSREPLSFWGGYDAATGEIIDRRHALSGQCGKNCILAIPGTRGSSTTTAVLLESVRRGTAPAGFLVTDRDTFLALASVVADEMYGKKLPVIRVSPADFDAIAGGAYAEIELDGDVAVMGAPVETSRRDVSTAAPIIDIKNATVFRGENRVFDGLSLTIETGCHTAILGPNGAGKSTLLRMLFRELYPLPRPDSHVRIWGRDRWDVKELRPHMGLVSHDLQMKYKPWVTGWEVALSGFDASIGLWPHQTFDEKQTERAKEVIEDLGVAHLQDRAFESMSTGEQRRFLLARALVHDPEVLILDEPTSGLDLKACFQYIDTIRTLMAKGKTIVLVTHHVHEIPPEIDRIVLLDRGKVIADGSKGTVLTDASLGRLFGIPLEVVQVNGFYQVMPGE